MRMTGIGSLGFTSEMVKRAVDGVTYVRAGGVVSTSAPLSVSASPAPTPSYKGDVVLITLPPSKEGITARLIPQPVLPNRGQQAPAKIVVSPTANVSAGGGVSSATGESITGDEEPATPAKPSLLPLGLIAWLLFGH